MADNAIGEMDTDSDCPLRLWNEGIQKLTAVNKVRDLTPAYKMLVNKLDQVCYNNRLKSDTTILIK